MRLPYENKMIGVRIEDCHLLITLFFLCLISFSVSYSFRIFIYLFELFKQTSQWKLSRFVDDRLGCGFLYQCLISVLLFSLTINNKFIH